MGSRNAGAHHQLAPGHRALGLRSTCRTGHLCHLRPLLGVHSRDPGVDKRPESVHRREEDLDGPRLVPDFRDHRMLLHILPPSGHCARRTQRPSALSSAPQSPVETPLSPTHRFRRGFFLLTKEKTPGRVARRGQKIGLEELLTSPPKERSSEQ